MASIDYEKLKSLTEIMAKLIHNDKEARLEHDHANENIDKSMTPKNWQMYERKEGDKSERVKVDFRRIAARIAELDLSPNANKRKDRVLAFSLEVPIVPTIKPEDYKRYSELVEKTIREFYPKSPIINSYWHVDEVHDYIDAATGEERTSLSHGHIIIIPEIDGRLNGKAFSSRKNMVELNKKMHEAILKEFGVPFMDGTHKKSKAKVEDLKAASKKKELDKRERDLEHKLEEIRELKKKMDALNATYNDAITSLNAIKERIPEEEAEEIQEITSKVATEVSAFDRFFKSNKTFRAELEDVAEMEAKRETPTLEELIHS